MTKSTKQERQTARARRTHATARVSGRPRLLIVRTNRTINAHIIDDLAGKIICGVSGLKTGKTGIDAATEVGTNIAEVAKKNKITSVAFDRNGYKYHGQAKALADAARKAGLEF
jgi:large subunit ribosomal protein L18